MVKFYGNNSEIIFDGKRGCVLCKFSNGELTTTDKYVIERLKELGFKYDEPKKETSNETSNETSSVKTTKTRTKKG